MTMHEHSDHDHSPPIGTAIDPVCGMSVEISTAQYTFESEAGTAYFCSAGCRTAFIANPDAFQIRGGEGMAPNGAHSHHKGQ